MLWGTLRAWRRPTLCPTVCWVRTAPQSAETSSAKLSLAGPETLCLPQDWHGQAAPREWSDQVSTGTEEQAFLSAMQDSGDLTCELGRTGIALLAK